MKKKDVIDFIENDKTPEINYGVGYLIYGIVERQAGLAPGYVLPVDHMLYQDDPYDDNAVFDEDKQMWDCGELEGVCAYRVKSSIRSIDEALHKAVDYDHPEKEKDRIYLVRGFAPSYDDYYDWCAQAASEQQAEYAWCSGQARLIGNAEVIGVLKGGEEA